MDSNMNENEQQQMKCVTVSRKQFLKMAVAMGFTVVGSSALAGCGSKAQEAPAPSEEKPKVEPAAQAPAEEKASGFAGTTVIDAKGNEFVIPDKIERIAITCNGGTTHEVVIFGGADKIVAEPSMKKFPQLLKMYPQLKDVTNAGSFDDLNIEAMISVEPDIALVGITSDKGNAQIADLGIPTYTMYIGRAKIDTLLQEFLNVGKIMENEKKAEDLVAHWDRVLGDLKKTAESIPADKRKKVYYIGTADITKANRGEWSKEWIDAIGADFAVPADNMKGDVSVELAASWDPDVIVVQGGHELDPLLNNEAIQDMKAIKEKQVYSVPIAGFWWDRPSPEATLGFLWLAQTVYPDYFGDIDLKQESKDFFKEFYNYELSDEDYESFFS
ncbi:MAG: ABC transporter substrate-binding protein [Coriobacteriia bacterium]|nr:ABC transporter substrate-binding protein [Coriobacteriia bacterium]